MNTIFKKLINSKLTIIGILLILVSSFLLCLRFYPSLYNKAKGSDASNNGVQRVLSKAQAKEANITPEITQSSSALKELNIIMPKNEEFGIVIPTIHVNESVIKDVDPFNKEEYSNTLEKGVAHAKGTSYPGQVGNIFLFAHSADEVSLDPNGAAFFYKLGDLELNDSVFVFYNSNGIEYKVRQKIIIEPTQLEYLTNKYDKETLTLMTCWPLGSNSHRLIIIAGPI